MPFPTPSIPALRAVRLGPIDELIELFRYVSTVERQNAPRTVKEEEQALRKLLGALGVPRVVTRADLLKALSTLKGSTRDRALWALRKVLRILGAEWLAEGIRSRRYAPRRWRVPSDEELKRFYEALDREDVKLAFRLLAETGLRKSEVLKARIGDIDWEHMALIPGRWTTTKRSGIGFFSAETAQMLKEHIAKLPDQGPETPIFPYKSDIWLKKAFKRAEARTGVHVTPQVLRVRFSDIMGYHEIPDRYVDIMQGRAPRSVLARHYTPLSIAKLRQMWKRAANLLSRPCQE